MRYIRLCIISLLATLPLAVHASPQPLEQIKPGINAFTRCRSLTSIALSGSRIVTANQTDS